MRAAVLLATALLVVACAAGAPALAPVVAPQVGAIPTDARPGPPTPATASAATLVPASTPAVPPPSATPTTPLATPGPTIASTPVPTPVVLDPPAKAGKFALDLYRSRAHVRQATASMCVPASMQIMLNLMRPDEPDRSRALQDELYALARSYSPWLTDERGGASARGWAAGLNELGYGQFELVAFNSMDEALHAAARQMRLTAKPAGLLVWRGDHAWVMSGFKATADPAWSDDFEVTAAWIEDPWFGRTDRTWGAGLRPHTLLSVEAMRDDFVVWTARHLSIVYGAAKFYVVLPGS